ncbi:MAG: aminoglycoside phosphotransferase [Hamadaea sp.]|nr:aminoglycoside phosphotransferase [Hamadaea sp.]
MQVTAAQVAAVADEIFGAPVTVAAWDAEQIAYESGSPATGGLLRVRGATTDGRPFSTFVKLIQHPRHWPRLHLLPEGFRDRFVAGFPWRQELDAWSDTFAGRLPAGLRVAALHRLEDLGDDRLLLFMEDVDACPDGVWDVALFIQAATALGGLAALRGTPEILATNDRSPGWGLRGYADGRVLQAAVPALADDDLWRHPLLAATVDPDLRTDLGRIAEAVPAILDRLDALPQALPHGDASPQNLLVPRDDRGTLVAIDISFQCPQAVGFDLGQLLIGLAHAGTLPAEGLAPVHERLVPAFLAGMAEYGGDADADEVTYGYLGSLVVRAALTSLPYEQLAGWPAEEPWELFRQRAALTRFLADLGLGLL